MNSDDYHEEKRIARYTNCNGVCAVIVAKLDFVGQKMLQWQAYIGGSTYTERREDAVEDVLTRTGCNLSDKLAAAIFPDLPMDKYRM